MKKRYPILATLIIGLGLFGKSVSDWQNQAIPQTKYDSADEIIPGLDDNNSSETDINFAYNCLKKKIASDTLKFGYAFNDKAVYKFAYIDNLSNELQLFFEDNGKIIMLPYDAKYLEIKNLDYNSKSTLEQIATLQLLLQKTALKQLPYNVTNTTHLSGYYAICPVYSTDKLDSLGRNHKYFTMLEKISSNNTIVNRVTTVSISNFDFEMSNKTDLLSYYQENTNNSEFTTSISSFEESQIEKYASARSGSNTLIVDCNKTGADLIIEY